LLGSPLGSPLGGSAFFFSTTFDLDRKDDHDKSIIVIGNLFGRKLVDYFHKNPKELLVMNRRKFEELVAELFYGFGYQVELTQRTRDGGKDIIAIGNMHSIASKYLIECKRPDPGKPIGVGVVRELMGVKSDERATKAIAVTTTYFSPDAKLFQERNRWELELKEYNDLLKWLHDYKGMHC